jgi:hypothetical protein
MLSRIFYLMSAAFGTIYLQAQNVGINTMNPIYPLTVSSNANGNGIGIFQQNAEGTVNIHMYTAASGGWLRSNSSLHLATNNSATPAITLASTGAGIGLGGAMPAYMLDLGGRLRLRHNTSLNTTAGLFLDAPGNMPARAFIGTINDDHVGIFGAGGANWNFAMNVVNGNTGIGTASPTAKLDINGSLRIRGSFPKEGSTLVSTDNLGNATWQGFVGFRTGEILDTFYYKQTLPGGGAWTKIVFPQSTIYNNGSAYQPWLSQFVAPVKGIYHFEALLLIGRNTWVIQTGLGLAGTRNGIALSLPFQPMNSSTVAISGDNPFVKRRYHLSISTDIRLEAGDIIWLRAYSSETTEIDFIYTDQNYFSGRLVTRL